MPFTPTGDGTPSGGIAGSGLCVIGFTVRKAHKIEKMAYDEDLADRVRVRLQGERAVTEKRMFGGLAFLIDGHLAVTASQRGGLLLRVDPAETEMLLTEAHTEPFEMRGREMDGWLLVAPAGVSSDAQLERWVSISLAYARSLPPKAPAPKRRRSS